MKYSKEQAKNIAKDLIPVVEEMEHILEEHGVTGYSKIEVGTRGYREVKIGDSGWSIKRYEKDLKNMLAFSYAEDL